MDTETPDYDTKPLIINDIDKELMLKILSGLKQFEGVDLAHLTNLNSIALISDDNQVVFLKSGSQNKPLTLLLNASSIETITCYTTYSASRAIGKRSCVHRDTTINGVTQTTSVCMENQAFFDSVTSTNYYLECNPGNSYPHRALLYYAERYVSDSGAVKWRKMGNPILDEK